MLFGDMFRLIESDRYLDTDFRSEKQVSTI